MAGRLGLMAWVNSSVRKLRRTSLKKLPRRIEVAQMQEWRCGSHPFCLDGGAVARRLYASSISSQACYGADF